MEQSRPTTGSARIAGLILVFLGCAVLTGYWIYGLSGRAKWSFGDFKCVYSGARCMVQGCNPYNENELIRTYAAAGGDPSQWFEVRKYNANYLPPALLLAIPFGILPWETAKVLWMILILGSFVVGALLVWNLSEPYAPVVSGALIGVFVAGSETLLRTANPAGIAIGLCAVAVWCFVKERFVIAGIVCFAISLIFKPHDSALIWTCLLLVSVRYRRRAIQILGVVITLSLPAILWVSLMPASSHWVRDLHANLVGNTSYGNADDPGPTNVYAFTFTNVQSVIGLVRDDSHIYNPVAYLICTGFLLVWLVPTLKAAPSRAKDFLALASISALSLLPVYHRHYDTRLLLLIFPATAMLWAGGGTVGWLALLLTIAGIAFTSARLIVTLNQLHTHYVGLAGKMLTIALHRPIPLIVLILCVFYLSIYLQRTKRGNPQEVPEMAVPVEHFARLRSLGLEERS